MESYLTVIDFQTATWKRFTKTLERELQSLRERNDSPSLGEKETALIRGEIKRIKMVLALADQASVGVSVVPDEDRAPLPE